MSQRRKVNRDDQRRARALMQRRGISYMQALELVRHSGDTAAGRQNLVTGWLKSIHYRHDGWTIQPGARTWISDVGRVDDEGNRVYRKDGTPWGEPTWPVGARIGLYFSGTLRVPILVEVTAPPRFDPDFVQTYNDGGEPDAGERWPWVTEVVGLRAVALRQAPTLDDLRVRHESMMQRSRFRLKPDQLHALERALH